MTTDELLRRIAPDHGLLLRAALCEDDDTSGVAFREWRERVVIEDLPGEAHRLLPLLARRMGEVAPDDPVRARVRGVYRHAWVKNHLIMRDASALATLLRQGGVPVLALKGAVLIGYFGNDSGRRPMYDVDLLVPVGQVREAFRVLTADGWHPRGGISEEWFRSRVVPRRHSWPFSREQEEQLDLHWHVLAGSLGATADDHFWSNAVPFDLGGVGVVALRPADLLLHVLAHGARSAERSYLQWIADAVHVLRSVDAAAIAEAVAEEARRHGLVTTARAALETIDLVLDEPRVRPLARHLSTTRPRFLERVAVGGRSRLTAPVRTAAEVVLEHGGGDAGAAQGVSRALRAGLDLDFVRRPVWHGAYALSGRRPSVARLARRRGAAYARTSAPPTLEGEPDLDFTDPAIADHHAGPGWWTVDDFGLWSHGPEARVVLDLHDNPGGDIELHLDARSYDQRPRSVEVRVNEQVVAHVVVGPLDSPGGVRVHVPAAAAWRFRPMEVSLLAVPARSRLRRERVGVRLLRLQITPSAASPA